MNYFSSFLPWQFYNKQFYIKELKYFNLRKYTSNYNLFTPHLFFYDNKINYLYFLTYNSLVNFYWPKDIQNLYWFLRDLNFLKFFNLKQIPILTTFSKSKSLKRGLLECPIKKFLNLLSYAGKNLKYRRLFFKLFTLFNLYLKKFLFNQFSTQQNWKSYFFLLNYFNFKNNTPIDESNSDESNSDESNSDESNSDESNSDESNSDESNSDESNSDESNSDESNSDESNSDESNSDESNSDESNSDESNSDESNSDESNSDESNSDESNSDESNSDESNSDESNSDESNSDESNSDESNSDESNSDESNSDESNSDESNSDESNSDESNSDESNSDESNSDESNSDESNSDESNSDESNSDELDEDELDEDELDEDELDEDVWKFYLIKNYKNVYQNQTLYSSLYINYFKFNKAQFSFENHILSLFKQIKPIFSFYIYDVGKMAWKHSRGKTGRFKLIWKYIPQYKRLLRLIQWFNKEFRSLPFKNLNQKIFNLLLIYTFNFKKTLSYKITKFSHNYVYKNFKFSFLKTLRTIR